MEVGVLPQGVRDRGVQVFLKAASSSNAGLQTFFVSVRPFQDLPNTAPVRDFCQMPRRPIRWDLFLLRRERREKLQL